jgi:hypothetical protein
MKSKNVVCYVCDAVGGACFSGGLRLRLHFLPRFPPFARDGAKKRDEEER